MFTDSVGTDFILDPSAMQEIPLAGNMPGMPGGGGSGDPLNYSFFSADPTGSWGVGTNPTINPNPTGGWMKTANDIISLAATGFKAFSQGSPQVAIPPPRPTGSMTLPSVTASGVGGVKWGAIAFVGGGILVAALLWKFA